MFRNARSWSQAICFALWLLFLPAAATASAIDAFAAMGASETAGNNFSGSWVPWLAVDRGLDFGAGQTNNKAIGGSTTTTLLSKNQHTDVANLVTDGKADLAFVFIGGLDVPPVATQMLLGTLNVPVWADGVVSRILTAVDTVTDAGAQGMVVAGLPDMRLVPQALTLFPDPNDAVAVANAIDLVNSKLKAEILDRNLVYLDVAGAMRDNYANGLVVGGVPINLTVGSPQPNHFFSDGIHPYFVGNGIFANLMIAALNKGYGFDITPFTDAQILAKAGLSGSYVGETSDIDYAAYVHVVPEPATTRFAAAAVVCFAAWALRQRVRKNAAHGAVMR